MFLVDNSSAQTNATDKQVQCMSTNTNAKRQASDNDEANVVDNPVTWLWNISTGRENSGRKMINIVLFLYGFFFGSSFFSELI